MFDNRKAKKLLKDLEAGKFSRYVDDPDALVDWIKRQRLIPHTETCVVRLTLPGDNGDFYLWVVYRFVDLSPNSVTFALESLYGPDDDEHALMMPVELQGRDFYAANK